MGLGLSQKRGGQKKKNTLYIGLHCLGLKSPKEGYGSGIWGQIQWYLGPIHFYFGQIQGGISGKYSGTQGEHSGKWGHMGIFASTVAFGEI